MRVGPDGIEPPTSSMWARRSTRLSYGPMTATRVMPCRGGGACSTTRPSEPGDRRETKLARAEGLEPPTKPGVGSRRSATELRASGRRDRDRTDGLLRFRQALYALLSYSPNCELPVDLAGLEPTASALQVRCSPVLSYRPKVPPPSLASGYSITLGQASTRPNVQCGPNGDRTPSPRKRKRPASGPSRSSRTNPVRVSGAPRMRTTSEPASHRCVLGLYQGR
jgi:hypothetical protein